MLMWTNNNHWLLVGYDLYPLLTTNQPWNVITSLCHQLTSSSTIAGPQDIQWLHPDDQRSGTLCWLNEDMVEGEVPTSVPREVVLGCLHWYRRLLHDQCLMVWRGRRRCGTCTATCMCETAHEWHIVILTITDLKICTWFFNIVRNTNHGFNYMHRSLKCIKLHIHTHVITCIPCNYILNPLFLGWKWRTWIYWTFSEVSFFFSENMCKYTSLPTTW